MTNFMCVVLDHCRSVLHAASVIVLALVAVPDTDATDDPVEKFEDFYHQRELAKFAGIEKIQISVDLDEHSDLFTANTCDLYAMCDSMVRTADLPVVTFEESIRRLKEGPPFEPENILSVRIMLLDAGTEKGVRLGSFFSVGVNLMQTVILEADTSVSMNAQTWNTSIVGSASERDLCRQIGLAVQSGVAEFLGLYRESKHR